MTRSFFSFLLCAVTVAFSSLSADPGPTVTALPGPGFAALHYSSLWSKSPFCAESAVSMQNSSDYTLVGLAEVDGVTYASLIEKRTDQHLLLSKSELTSGLKLVAINCGSSTVAPSAVIEKNGEVSELPLEHGRIFIPNAPISPVISVPPGGAGDMAIEEMNAKAAAKKTAFKALYK